MCFYLLNLCVNHYVLSFFSFLCDNLLLQKRVQSLCSNTVILCVNLIDPKFTLNREIRIEQFLTHDDRVPYERRLMWSPLMTWLFLIGVAVL